MNASYAVALLAVALLAVALLALPRPKPPPAEPSYQGRTLTQLAMLSPNAHNNNRTSAEAKAAVRAIGTNALPCLLAWLSAYPDHEPIKQAVGHITDQLPDRFPFQSARQWGADDPAILHFEVAAYLFGILGPDATPAIPELERIATDPRGHPSAFRAIYILGGIGTNALPALQRIAQNLACPTRNEAAKEIARRTNPPAK
jgi:hypothetical protein